MTDSARFTTRSETRYADFFMDAAEENPAEVIDRIRGKMGG